MSGHPIPFAALDGKVGVLGITGSGKTFTAIGLVEQLLDAGRQTIIVDPTGAYHGLRSVYPIPIFGGSAGDAAIGEDDGAAIARLIVARDLSCVVDVSLLLKASHASARRFMAGFVAALKESPPRARYLVLDEADEFMPEHAGGGDTRLFGDLKWIVRRGRKDGWRVLMITQRPQDIAKSVLTQCETMVIHQLTAPQDRKAVEEWVKGNADPSEAKEVLGSLASLAVGEAWIWSPRHQLLLRATLPANRSADGSRTPDADDAPLALARLESADIEALRAALAKAGKAESHKASYPEDTIPAEPIAAYENGRATGTMLRERDDRIVELEVQAAGMRTALRAARRLADEAREAAGRAVDALGAALSEASAENSGAIPDLPAAAPSGDAETVTVVGPPWPTPAFEAARLSATAREAAALLRVARKGTSWDDLLLAIGRRPNSGDSRLARKSLIEAGLMIVSEGLCAPGPVADRADITPAPMPSPEELRQLWAGKLRGPGGAMLVELAQNGPASRAGLGQRLGKSATSGWFRQGLKDLLGSRVAADRDGILFLHPSLLEGA